MSSAFFISDVHLHRLDSVQGEALIKVLKQAQNEATLFVILGDLFDLWVGASSVLQKKYVKLIDEIKILSEKCRVLYIEGNHDFHLKDFWQEKLRCEVYSEPVRFEFGGLKIRAEHGDLANENDHGYLLLRKFFRSSPIRALVRTVPSGVVSGVGELASRISRRFSHSASHDLKRDEQIKKIVRDYSCRQREKENFDILVLGHTHVGDDFSFESSKGSGRVINLGSWYEGPHFLRIQETGDSEMVYL